MDVAATGARRPGIYYVLVVDIHHQLPHFVPTGELRVGFIGLSMEGGRSGASVDSALGFFCDTGRGAQRRR